MTTYRYNNALVCGRAEVLWSSMLASSSDQRVRAVHCDAYGRIVRQMPELCTAFVSQAGIGGTHDQRCLLNGNTKSTWCVYMMMGFGGERIRYA